jgi:hypothetical protein
MAIGAQVPDAGAAASRGAPVLRANGHLLEWTRLARRDKYKLQIRFPGHRQLVKVTGHTYRPAAIPGARVIYRVKAAFNESRWSNPLVIAYAAGEEKLERPREEAPPLQEAGLGHVKYRLDAASFFDRFAKASFAPWIRGHVSLIKGYPSFADSFPSLFGLPVIGYHDPATEGQAPLGPGEIQAYVGKVARDMAHGYSGVFIDDANWSAGFSPSPGPPANLAHLIEAVRAAEPRALIEINSQFHDIWPLIKAGNPEVARALADVDLVCVENGMGPTSGIDSPGEYAEFIQYADTLHGKGIGLTLTGDRNSVTPATMEYNLATYFLINSGADYVNGNKQTPEGWWSGFEVNLGNGLGPPESQPSGLWTRRFTGGVVYAVAPGGQTQTINLPGAMHSAEWGTVTSLTLAAGQGAVLVG